MTLSKNTDRYGTVWEITPDHKEAQLEIFWSDAPQGEVLCIRQEREDLGVDLVTITLGQTYDLIQALSQAVESN